MDQLKSLMHGKKIETKQYDIKRVLDLNVDFGGAICVRRS